MDGFEQRVRERAYEIWMAGGAIDGHAGAHWIAAECEILLVSGSEVSSEAPGETVKTDERLGAKTRTAKTRIAKTPVTKRSATKPSTAGSVVAKAPAGKAAAGDKAPAKTPAKAAARVKYPDSPVSSAHSR